MGTLVRQTPFARSMALRCKIWYISLSEFHTPHTTARAVTQNIEPCQAPQALAGGLWPDSTSVPHTEAVARFWLRGLSHQGHLTGFPVAIQSCRMTSVRKQIFLAPTRSAWRENWQCWQTKSKPWLGRFCLLV